MRIAALLATITLLAACSTAPEIDTSDLEAWVPLPGRATEAVCADLYEGWGDESSERPVGCWTYEESDGLPATFRELADSFEEQVGGDIVVAPACQGSTPDRRAFTCTASWTYGDQVVTVTSGVTVHWMEEMVAQVPPVSYSDPTLTGTHEVILWLGDSAPTDDVGLYTDPV